MINIFIVYYQKKAENIENSKEKDTEKDKEKKTNSPLLQTKLNCKINRKSNLPSTLNTSISRKNSKIYIINVLFLIFTIFYFLIKYKNNLYINFKRLKKKCK